MAQLLSSLMLEIAFHRTAKNHMVGPIFFAFLKMSFRFVMSSSLRDVVILRQLPFKRFPYVLKRTFPPSFLPVLTFRLLSDEFTIIDGFI